VLICSEASFEWSKKYFEQRRAAFSEISFEILDIIWRSREKAEIKKIVGIHREDSIWWKLHSGSVVSIFSVRRSELTPSVKS
jgi:hypothetical protein